MTAEPVQVLCPSAQPDMARAEVLGVVRGTADRPRLAYLTTSLPVTPELLKSAAPIRPTEVFRFAAPCAGSACQHFDGTNCRLADRIGRLLPAVVATLPPCRLRLECRWWRQEGRTACERCPQVVTESQPQDRLMVEVAGVATTTGG